MFSVHFWGLIKNDSLGGGKYPLALIDDYPRKTWVYILKSKSETPLKLKIWHAEVTNENNQNLNASELTMVLSLPLKSFGVFVMKWV